MTDGLRPSHRGILPVFGVVAAMTLPADLVKVLRTAKLFLGLAGCERFLGLVRDQSNVVKKILVEKHHKPKQHQ
jgi:hypothetical protein